MRRWILEFSARFNHPILLGYLGDDEDAPDVGWAVGEAVFIFNCRAVFLPYPMYMYNDATSEMSYVPDFEMLLEIMNED